MAALLRLGVSQNCEPTRLERREIIGRRPLGRGIGKNRHVATTVIVKMLNTPLTRTVATFITVKRTDPEGSVKCSPRWGRTISAGSWPRQPLLTCLAENHE